MKEFLLLFRGGNAGNDRNESPEQVQAHMQKWMTWMGKLGEQGKMVGAQPLEAVGKTVRGSKLTVTDGPFIEGKELVGGYLVCKAADINEAVEISKGCPIFAYEDASVEVRPIQEMNM